MQNSYQWTKYVIFLTETANNPLPGRVANLLQIVFEGTVTWPHIEFKLFVQSTVRLGL